MFVYNFDVHDDTGLLNFDVMKMLAILKSCLMKMGAWWKRKLKIIRIIIKNC